MPLSTIILITIGGIIAIGLLAILFLRPAKTYYPVEYHEPELELPPSPDQSATNRLWVLHENQNDLLNS